MDLKMLRVRVSQRFLLCRGDSCHCALPDLTSFLRSFLPPSQSPPVEPKQAACAAGPSCRQTKPGSKPALAVQAERDLSSIKDSNAAGKQPMGDVNGVQSMSSHQPSASTSSGTNTSVDLPDLMSHRVAREEASAASHSPGQTADDSSKPAAESHGEPGLPHRKAEEASSRTGTGSLGAQHGAAADSPDERPTAASLEARQAAAKSSGAGPQRNDVEKPSSPDLTPPAASASTAKMAAKDVTILADALKEVMCFASRCYFACRRQ